MTLVSLAVNDQPIEDLGMLPLSSFDGWLDAPERTFSSSPLWGRQGGVGVAGSLVYAPRTLVLGYQRTAATMSLSRDALGQLYQLLDGLLEITVIDAPNRMIYANFQKARGSVFSVPLLNADYITLGTLIASNPFWYDTSPVSTMLPTGVATPIPYGTAPGNWTCWVAGAATTPTLTLSNAQGVTLAQMRFTANGGLTLGANDFLRLETREGLKIKLTVAGVESDGWAYLNAADTFFALDPNDAGYLTLSAGTGLLATWRGFST